MAYGIFSRSKASYDRPDLVAVGDTLDGLKMLGNIMESSAPHMQVVVVDMDRFLDNPSECWAYAEIILMRVYGKSKEDADAIIQEMA